MAVYADLSGGIVSNPQPKDWSCIVDMWVKAFFQMQGFPVLKGFKGYHQHLKLDREDNWKPV